MDGFILMESKLNEKLYRSRQDSNLRGQSPIDFESIALTTRPQLLVVESKANYTTLSYNVEKFCHRRPCCHRNRRCDRWALLVSFLRLWLIRGVISFSN